MFPPPHSLVLHSPRHNVRDEWRSIIIIIQLHEYEYVTLIG